MKKSHLLRRAKALMWNGEGPDTARFHFVSNAVDVATTLAAVGKQGPAANPIFLAGYEIRSEIRKRLGGKTMAAWLVDQGVPRSRITPRKLQRHKLAWMDVLIAEFEARGD